jgi:repressor LexA
MANDILEELGKAINTCGMSMSEIARKSGLSRNMLYKILNKDVQTVSMDTINAICKAISYNVDYIINPDKERKGVKIPVLGTIPAGIPIEAVEDILDYEEISESLAKTGEFFALKVRGDSMTPTINNGDVLIVKKTDDAESGKICVIMINGFDATLKQIKKEQNGIWVLPHNPNCDFKPTFYTNAEIETLPIKIIGVAIEIRRTL